MGPSSSLRDWVSHFGVAAEHVEYPALPHDFYVMGDVSPAVAEAARETAAKLKAALG